MISLIVYGRNDSYGYNLHKRAALSINNFAEMLSDPDDEILFVDYNTDRGLPPFPFAIADTLTPKALKKLKVFSVTAAMHDALDISTHLRTLEPIARNVALRRSNPRNRWVLSTNTDMIFIPREGQSVTAVAKNLKDGIYGLPRFELPEGLWESLPRTNPGKVIEIVGDWGQRYSLNQVTYSHEPHVFDAPGDFQLMLRQDLIDIDGFDESMVLGWHVDSNIAKRMSFIRGTTQDLSHAIAAYHCDHTRVETPMHKPGARSNSILKYIDFVKTPHLPSQRDKWGLAESSIRAQGLSPSSSTTIERVLAEAFNLLPQEELTARNYNPTGYDTDEPTDSALAPFLIDFFCAESKDLKVLWVGSKAELVGILAQILGTHQPNAQFDFLNPLDENKASGRNFFEYDVIVLDYRCGHLEKRTTQTTLIGRLNALVVRMNVRAALKSTSNFVQIVGIDVTNKSHWETFVSQVDSVRTPYSIGFCHGKLKATLSASLFRFTVGLAKRSLKRMLLRTLLLDHLARRLGFSFRRHILIQNRSDKPLSRKPSQSPQLLHKNLGKPK
ncbi:hypothetical protein N9M74_00835 [Pontimonas sp.]|nr:hypothetical protein [Pontimonas sp.]